MKKLTYWGGNGYDYSQENGKFEVKAKYLGKKQFTKLSEAKKYYDSLNAEKSIWDITKLPELLECHYYENNLT